MLKSLGSHYSDLTLTFPRPGPGPELDKMYQAISNQVSPENSDRIHSFSPPPTAVTEGVLLDYHNTLYFLLCSPHVLLGLLTGVD